MTALPLGREAYQRNYAYEPDIQMLNRFFENNPTNTEDGTALLARPGHDPLFTATGNTGLTRGFFSAPGLYEGDLFTVIGNTLYRYRPDGTIITVGGEIFGTGRPSMALMVGPDYSRLFIADGILLQYYEGGSLGTATLTVSGTITNQVIQIGSSYFTWGDPAVVAAGTSSNPWKALIGANNAESLDNMRKLLMYEGERGVDFSINLGGQNGQVTATSNSTQLIVTSRSDLASANSIATTVFSGTGLSWGTATITGAGVHVLHGVEMPDGQPAQSVAALAGYILVSIANSGRFYWLQPGEITIDGLDFATAESQPDSIVELLSVGDTIWMIGDASTEAWYATGNLETPFLPTQGRVYARGVVQGTSVRVKDQVVLVGSDGIVYSIGGGIKRISHHGIEEKIRLQLKRELA